MGNEGRMRGRAKISEAEPGPRGAGLVVLSSGWGGLGQPGVCLSPSLLVSPFWPLRFGRFSEPCSFCVLTRGRSDLQRGPPFWSWRDS